MVHLKLVALSSELEIKPASLRATTAKLLGNCGKTANSGEILLDATARAGERGRNC